MENAVDLKKFDNISDDKKITRKKLNMPLDKKIIIYSGIIGDSRGLDTIMDAAKILDNNMFSFYFVGGGTKKALKKWKNYKNKNQKV